MAKIKTNSATILRMIVFVSCIFSLVAAQETESSNKDVSQSSSSAQSTDMCKNITMNIYGSSACNNEEAASTSIFLMTSPLFDKGTDVVLSRCVNMTDANFTGSFSVECSNTTMNITSFIDGNCSSELNQTDVIKLGACSPVWQGTQNQYIKWKQR